MFDSMRRNVTILALAQVGAVGLGMIAGGLSARRLAEAGASNAAFSQWFREYGFTLAALPLLWYLTALYAFRTDYTSTRKDVLVLLSGLVLLAALLYGAYRASPFGGDLLLPKVSLQHPCADRHLRPPASPPPPLPTAFPCPILWAPAGRSGGPGRTA